MHPILGTAILFVVLIGTAMLTRPFITEWGLFAIAATLLVRVVMFRL